MWLFALCALCACVFLYCVLRCWSVVLWEFLFVHPHRHVVMLLVVLPQTSKREQYDAATYDLKFGVRSPMEQAKYQVYTELVTLGIAIVSGAAVAVVLSYMPRLDPMDEVCRVVVSCRTRALSTATKRRRSQRRAAVFGASGRDPVVTACSNGRPHVC